MRITDLKFDHLLFWKNISIGDECWTWKPKSRAGSLGYGSVKVQQPVNGRNKPRTMLAHRLMYLVVHGEIPNGLNVLHKCDNPRCVNPAHLWIGTQRENIHDCRRKGRARNGNIKLALSKIESIRSEPSPHNYTKIGAKHGISRRQVKRIITGECWSDINCHPEKRGRKNDRRPQAGMPQRNGHCDKA